MQQVYREDRMAILLATYNGGLFLKEQLDSLFGQTDQDWHLYIHDDGSADDTVSVLEAYQKRYPDRITVMDGAPTGSAKNNFYYLLSRVEAPLYMFSDQDDVWLPDKIRLTRRAWEKHSSAEKPVLVFSDLKIADEKLNVISESMWNYYRFNTKDIQMRTLIVQNVVTGCTMLVNRALRDAMLKYRHIENIPMHDKWAAMIAVNFGEIVRLNRATILYRQHSHNSVGAQKSSGIGYIRRRLSALDAQKAMYAFTRRQAQEFCAVFPDADPVLRAYGQSDSRNKLSRILVCVKYRIWANRLSQKIGFLISG